jgi:beta-mannosidase
VSWAVVDYYLLPKPAYYAIKREMKPVVVGVTRKFRDWTMRPADELWKRDTGHVDMRKIWEDVECDVWVANSTLETYRGKVVLRFISIKTGKDVRDAVSADITMKANGTTEVFNDFKVDVRGERDDKTSYDPSKADPFVIFATVEVNGEQLSSHISWPDPIKYLNFRYRGVTVKHSEDGALLTISAEKPVKGFVIAEARGTKLSDNGFDLVPGQKVQVRVSGNSSYLTDYTWVGYGK